MQRARPKSTVEDALVSSLPHILGPFHFPVFADSHHIFGNSALGTVLQDGFDDEMSGSVIAIIFIVGAFCRPVTAAVGEADVGSDGFAVEFQGVQAEMPGLRGLSRDFVEKLVAARIGNDRAFFLALPSGGFHVIEALQISRAVVLGA